MTRKTYSGRRECEFRKCPFKSVFKVFGLIDAAHDEEVFAGTTLRDPTSPGYLSDYTSAIFVEDIFSVYVSLDKVIGYISDGSL
jgi:hypothetical protein